LNLMHSTSFFSWFVFDEFIAKGGECMGIKLVELFAIRMVERRNIVNVYLKWELALRVLEEVDFRVSF
jgi:hypothetical protein